MAHNGDTVWLLMAFHVVILPSETRNLGTVHHGNHHVPRRTIGGYLAEHVRTVCTSYFGIVCPCIPYCVYSVLVEVIGTG